MSELITGRQSEGENKFQLLQRHIPLVLVYLEGAVSEEQAANMALFISLEHACLATAARDAGLETAGANPVLEKIGFHLDKTKYQTGEYSKLYKSKKPFETEFLREFHNAAEQKPNGIDEVRRKDGNKLTNQFVLNGVGKVIAPNILENIARLTQEQRIMINWDTNYINKGNCGQVLTAGQIYFGRQFP